jgi:hypothetical protein
MNKIIYSGTQTDACGKTGNDLDFLFYYAIIYTYMHIRGKSWNQYCEKTKRKDDKQSEVGIIFISKNAKCEMKDFWVLKNIINVTTNSVIPKVSNVTNNKKCQTV